MSKYDVDSQVVRSFFTYDTTRQGLLAASGRLFGLTFVDVSASVPVWHSSVEVTHTHAETQSSSTGSGICLWNLSSQHLLPLLTGF